MLRIGVLSSKNGGRRPPLLSPQAGRGGACRTLAAINPAQRICCSVDYTSPEHALITAWLEPLRNTKRWGHADALVVAADPSLRAGANDQRPSRRAAPSRQYVICARMPPQAMHTDGVPGRQAMRTDSLLRRFACTTLTYVILAAT